MLSLLLLIGLIRFKVNRFLKMMFRMRWLFVSMWLLCAFTTPGEYLHDWPIGLIPSYEGMRVGLIQIFRISLVLAGVTILMASSTQEKLMVGIYQLIRHLEILGIPCERFTARLYLTLQYIENTRLQPDNTLKSLGWHHRFEHLLNDAVKVGRPESIHLENTDFSMLDYICLAFLFVLLGISFGVLG
jgi:energy-coupling factor transport system permease protein